MPMDRASPYHQLDTNRSSLQVFLKPMFTQKELNEDVHLLQRKQYTMYSNAIASTWALYCFLCTVRHFPATSESWRSFCVVLESSATLLTVHLTINSAGVLLTME